MAEITTKRVTDSPYAWVLAALAAGCGVAGLMSLADMGAPTILKGLLAVGFLGGLALAILAKPERGLWLMLIAIPLDTAGRLITSPVTVTIFHMTLLLTLASWAIRWMVDPKDGRPRWSVLDIGIALLLAGAFWSLPGSLAPEATIVSIARLSFLWLFFLLFMTWMRTERSIYRVVLLVVTTAALSAVVALLQQFVPGFDIGQINIQRAAEGPIIRPAAFFHDPNYLGTFFSVAILAALGMAISARRAWHAAPWLIPVGLCSVGIIMTFSRTAWLGVLVGMLVLVITAPKARRGWLLGALLVLAVSVVLIAPGVVASRFASIVDVEADASIQTRYLMLDSSVEMLERNWVFGTGLAAYEVAYPPYRRSGATLGITKPHQLPLALWVEMGLFGLIAQLAILGGLAWTVGRRRGRQWSAYESIGLAGLVSLFAQSFFQYYLYYEYLWLFLAITVAAARLSANHEEVST